MQAFGLLSYRIEFRACAALGLGSWACVELTLTLNSEH